MNVPTIHLKSVSKKFHKYFLYKDLNIDILPQDKVVITGNNGAGKSTLLKIIIGLLSPTSGKVEYVMSGMPLQKNYWHRYVSVAATYMSILEDFSVTDVVRHLYLFRQYQVEQKELLSLLQLDKHLHKPIKQFSSGMKQKTKLLLAITDAAPVLLLDEPISNLDANAIQWYAEMIKRFALQKTIIVFSNSQQQEYFFCNKFFHLSN